MKITRLAVSLFLVAALAGVGLAAESSEAKKPDIIETAAKMENLSNTVQALKGADLVETLKGEGPFTLFAPANSAWDKLPEATKEARLDPKTEGDKAKLQMQLLQHVAAGAIKGEAIAGMPKIETMEGSPIKVIVKEGKVTLDKETKLLKTDIVCGNGVIHIIDTIRPRE